MPKLLLILLLFFPVSGFSQSVFQLPDGSEMRAYLSIPEAADGSTFPLLIAMGGGPGNGRIASSTSQNLGQQFVQRGWAVVVPVSPNGQSFWGDNAARVRQLIALVKQRPDIEDGSVLLAGVSNGGISALDIASRYPREYLGVIAIPGLASDASALSSLKDKPVYLRIGSEDQLNWASRYEATVQVLKRAGVKLDARLIPGAGHTFEPDWSQLEQWLASLKEQ